LKRHIKAIKKYNNAHIVVIGHSRAALYAKQLYEDGFAQQLVTYNKPVNMVDIATNLISGKKQKNDPNVTNIRTSGDVISMGSNLLVNPNKNDIIIPSKTLNPLYEHKSDRIGSLDETELIGNGIFKKTIDFSKIRVKQLRDYIKTHKVASKLKINITGLTKKQMIKIVEILLQ